MARQPKSGVTFVMVQAPPKPDPDLIDWDDLKERIRDGIRAAMQECADELGLSYDEFLDRYCREGTNDGKTGPC